MPLFEYHCVNCKKEFETLVLDSDELIKCLHCSSEKVEKQFSSFGVNRGKADYESDSSSAINCGCNMGCGCNG
ncbi:MAG: zinc ribbon domain-containing protein [Candidatus Dadabacteria bacterium]|nr:zinc ribbon domain-containing protein [Candidatus Dadabacteria bacterium]NIQ16355.1 zinc ribbon domain-containing protein [Candidatus Dadabacteria bacterium]